MGLTGGVLIVAAFVGAVTYSNKIPAFLTGAGAHNPPLSDTAEPAAAKKKFPAAKAKALGEATQKITAVLDREGMNVVREIDAVANGPAATSSKQQVYEVIGRLDRMRNQTRAVDSIVWIDVLPAYPSIASELQDIVQNDDPLKGLEGASKLYFDGLTTVVTIYDKVDAAAKEQLLQLLNPTRDAFRQAASKFQNWIQECKSRIDEKQKALN
jgi:hypothetical protein